MMRWLFALALLALALPSEAGASWSSLWRNADQRGETLLLHGDAAAAAKVYTDPRRKAYAELKAGDYAAAARDLAAFDEGDANYNRGNALAHAGDLHGAIRAYDAALKRDPHNRDARHNRELVANALKQKPPQQQGSGGDKPQDGKQGGKNSGDQGSTSPNQGKQSDQAKPDTNGRNDRQAQSSAPNPAQAGQKNGHSGADHRPSEPGSPGNSSAQQNQQPQNAQGKAVATRQANPNQQADTEQAKRDAVASLAKAAAGKQGGADIGDATGNGNAQAATAPLNEKQMAQEQWLRSIPDDPGGLLRRKFLIEHLMRKQNTQP
ncbi:MAG TPA: tetratricopeptide repeat protein [Sulfuricella sp.]|nr:tetratricopeptide repeat protein [Sulfuricella sp.]